MELSSLAHSLGPKAPETAGSDLHQAAEAFEGAFLQILLKSMRATIPDGGLFDRQQMAAFEEMQDRELADSLAGKGTLGIAATIVRQLGGESAAAIPQSARELSLAHSGGAVSGGAPAAVTAQPHKANREQFIRELWPAAQRVAGQLKVSAGVLVAQAGLETGWGEHVPKLANGQSSNNLFGIKSTANWSGEQAWNQTTEYLGGKLRQVMAGFRAYPSIAESIADYAHLISTTPRYEAALKANGDRAYLDSIQTAGYATDPQYAHKIDAIMNDPQFQAAAASADSELSEKP